MSQGSPLLDQRALVVRQQPRTVDSRTGYDVCDPAGVLLGSVVEVGESDLEKLAHPTQSREKAAEGAPEWLVKRFEVSTAEGEVVLRLSRIRAARKTLVVSGADDHELGRVRQENLVGRARLALEAGGVQVGRIRSEQGWLRQGLVGRAQQFALTSGDAGPQVAHITMTRIGNVNLEVNEYKLDVSIALADPLRALVLAAPVAIDQALYE